MSPTGQFPRRAHAADPGCRKLHDVGARAVQRPLSPDVQENGIGTLLLFHYPSTWNHVLGDHAITFRVLPLGPELTQVTTKMARQQGRCGRRRLPSRRTHPCVDRDQRQDRQIVEENAFGIRSPAYRPGPYSPEDEGGVMQFVEWLRELHDRTPGRGDDPVAGGLR